MDELKNPSPSIVLIQANQVTSIDVVNTDWRSVIVLPILIGIAYSIGLTLSACLADKPIYRHYTENADGLNYKSNWYKMFLRNDLSAD